MISGCVLHVIFGSRRSDVIALAERSFLAELQRSTARSFAASASVDTTEGSLSCARMPLAPPQLLVLLLQLLLRPPHLPALLPPPSCSHQQEVPMPLASPVAIVPPSVRMQQRATFLLLQAIRLWEMLWSQRSRIGCCWIRRGHLFSR